MTGRMGAVASGLVIAVVSALALNLAFDVAMGKLYGVPLSALSGRLGVDLGELVIALAMTVVGGWAAARGTGRAPLLHGGVVGALMTLFLVSLWLLIQVPLWVRIAHLVLPVPAGVLGGEIAGRAARRRPRSFVPSAEVIAVAARAGARSATTVRCPKCGLKETERGSVVGWYCRVCGWREERK